MVAGRLVRKATPDSLLSAASEHIVEFQRYCGQSPGGELYESSELIWAISGVLSPFMNCVVKCRLGADGDVNQRIREVIDRAGRRTVPIGWYIMPGTEPVGIADSLLAHGFRHDADDPAMSVDLRTLPMKIPAPDGFHIAEVVDSAMMEQWVAAWGDSYGAGQDHRQSRLDFRAGTAFGAGSNYRSFIGFLGQRPVATSELFLGGGIAAIFWVGAVEDVRRMGIGAAVTLAPLLEARRLGYEVAALTASKKGYSVYEKLGFREMCRIPVYIWDPPQ